MMSLTNFLSLLPGIKPRLARNDVLTGSVLAPGEHADIHTREAFLDTTLDVGPDAAAAIVAAYRDGRLSMKRGAVPRDVPKADAYASDAEVRRRRDERRRRSTALRDLSVVRESDLNDHAFLDRLFHAHAGRGEGTLTIAGIAVTKSLARYASNSGRSSGWGVSFNWTGSDGEPRSLSTFPSEAFNRRNDGDRNWGLPE